MINSLAINGIMNILLSIFGFVTLYTNTIPMRAILCVLSLLDFIVTFFGLAYFPFEALSALWSVCYLACCFLYLYYMAKVGWNREVVDVNVRSVLEAILPHMRPEANEPLLEMMKDMYPEIQSLQDLP